MGPARMNEKIERKRRYQMFKDTRKTNSKSAYRIPKNNNNKKKTPVAISLACAYAGSSTAYGARQHSSTYTIEK